LHYFFTYTLCYETINYDTYNHKLYIFSNHYISTLTLNENECKQLKYEIPRVNAFTVLHEKKRERIIYTHYDPQFECWLFCYHDQLRQYRYSLHDDSTRYYCEANTIPGQITLYNELVSSQDFQNTIWTISNTDTKNIISVDLYSGHNSTVYSSEMQILHLKQYNNQLLWFQRNNHDFGNNGGYDTIYTIPLNAKSSSSILTPIKITDFAIIDNIAFLMTFSSILSCNYYKNILSNCKVIVNLQNVTLASITAGDSKLFWVENLNYSCQRIAYSNYDGSNIQTLIVNYNTSDSDFDLICPIEEQVICNEHFAGFLDDLDKTIHTIYVVLFIFVCIVIAIVVFIIQRRRDSSRHSLLAPDNIF